MIANRIPSLLCMTLFWLSGWLLLATPAAAQGLVPAPSDWATQAEHRILAIEQELRGWGDGIFPEIQNARYKEVADIRDQADTCVTEAESGLQSAQEKLDALGEPQPDEDAELTRRRGELTSQRKLLERRRALCRLLTLGSRELIDRLQAARQEQLSEALMAKDQPIWTVAESLLRSAIDPEQLLNDLRQREWNRALLIGALVLIPLVYLSVMIYRWRSRIARALPPRRHQAMVLVYVMRMPWLALVASAGVVFQVAKLPAFAALAYAVAASLIIAPLAQWLVCRGRFRCSVGTPTRLLAAFGILLTAVYLADLDTRLPESFYLTLRASLAFLILLSSLWLLWTFTARAGNETLRGLRLPLLFTFSAAPVAEWLGYRSMAEYLGLGIAGTVLGIWLIWELQGAVRGYFKRIETGESESGQKIRRAIGATTDSPLPTAGWLGLFTSLGLLVLLGVWLLRIWGLSDADLTVAIDFFNEGFAIGNVQIVPSQLTLAVLILVLLSSMVGWLKRQMDERWLVKTKLDKGARQSIVALTSYTLIGLGIVFALSLAGLNFQNLAIVAGALSVGIGFGLQNIVNNFVSGLILLFERPIRPGDWVVVGQTEGTVQKISIRYTQIRTFDRADVLVPNSELISNHVLNWQLSNPFGRVKVQVGVAYGSDTRLVRDILLRLAKQHPLIMGNDARVPTPKVHFMAFGDSSLNFELWFFIHDIENKLTVRTDIMFAIDDEFRKAGIEIPFPQRVIHQGKSDSDAPEET